MADSRTGRNNRHSITAQFRQSVFGRLAGYEDVNDAERLGDDPAMRWVVAGRAVTKEATSTSQMGRFETEVLTNKSNLTALAELSGRLVQQPPDHGAHRQHAAGRSRGTLLRRAKRAAQGSVTQTKQPPGKPGRFTPSSTRAIEHFQDNRSRATQMITAVF